jgi:hypothetical protein
MHAVRRVEVLPVRTPFVASAAPADPTLPAALKRGPPLHSLNTGGGHQWPPCQSKKPERLALASRSGLLVLLVG